MNDKSGQAIIEYTQIGTIVRVTAVDTATGLEVSFQAPANTPRSSLERTAISKLQYVMRKRSEG
jgi:hypothetical protein